MAGVRSTGAPSNSGVARVPLLLGGDDELVAIVDSPAPRSRAAASSISPNKKFQNEAIFASNMWASRFGIQRGQRKRVSILMSSTRRSKGN